MLKCSGRTSLLRTLVKRHSRLKSASPPLRSNGERHFAPAGLHHYRRFDASQGGVLFVDEAYTLASGSEKDFGREAINELMSVMNDGDPVMIFAGYLHPFTLTPSRLLPDAIFDSLNSTYLCVSCVHFESYAVEMERFVQQNAGLFRRIDVFFTFQVIYILL